MNNIIKESDLNIIKNYLKEHHDLYYLIFSISINTGLSISKIIDFKYDDIFLENKCVRNYIYGGNTFFLNDEIKKGFEDLISNKEIENDSYIFMNKHRNNKINRSAFYRVLKNSLEKLNMNDYKGGNEICRKTYAYHFIRKTNNVEHLKKVFNKSYLEILKYAEIPVVNIEEFKI